jgi:3-phenylpropionate/trans-cinnamate dioxygenase ferredoxin reductase component
MQRYKYLIVGGGMTADAAAHGIRERDKDGGVGIIAAEAHAPYSRPPLSKALWKGEPLDSIWRGTKDLGVDLHLGLSVESLDANGHRVTDDKGGEYAFERLLLATGARPRRLPFASDGVIYFRTLDDYRQLRALAEPGARVIVIGAGFIGSEVAAALSMVGARVTLVFPEEHVGSRVFAPELSSFLSRMYREKGVELMARDAVLALERRDGVFHARTRSGRTLEARAVVAGIGVEPNVELARAAGLTTDNGIVVDELLRTTHADVFAAGDVASAPSAVFGRHVRVEHEDAALTMGKAAGGLMAGSGESYRHVPFFYSDLFELGYEAVGELDARLDIVADWRQPFKEGVLYYLADGRPRGVLLWNVFGQVEAARELLRSGRQVRAEELRGRIAA